jgi:hypothetical protein
MTAAASERILLAALAAAIAGRYGVDLVISKRTALDFATNCRRRSLGADFGVVVGAVWLAAEPDAISTRTFAHDVWVTAISVAIVWGGTKPLAAHAAVERESSPSLSDVVFGLGLAPAAWRRRCAHSIGARIAAAAIQALRRTRLLMILVAGAGLRRHGSRDSISTAARRFDRLLSVCRRS